MPLDRRVFLASLAATAASASRAAAQARGPAQPVPDEAYFDGLVEDNGFSFRKTNMKQIAARFRRQLVKYIHKEPPGSLVVDTKNHALYVTFENNTALRYGVGVGQARASSGSGAPRSAARRCGPIGCRRPRCWRAARTCRSR